MPTRFWRSTNSGRPASSRTCARRWPSAASRSARAPCRASSSVTRSRAKNTAHAAEQQRSHVTAEREDWFAAQDERDPDRLVFIDETATATTKPRA